MSPPPPIACSPVVTVWPSKFVDGTAGVIFDDLGRPCPVDKDGKSAPVLPAVAIGEAFACRYTTDAHFVPYVLTDVDGSAIDTPRVNRSATAKLEAVGLSLAFLTVPIDIDDPAVHGTGEAASDAWRAALSVKLGEVETTYFFKAVTYDTRGGARFVGVLSAALRTAEYLELLAGLHHVMGVAGIVTDRLIDVQRCFRLPFVVRDGKRQERPARLEYVPLSEDAIDVLRGIGREHPLRAPVEAKDAPTLPFREPGTSDERPGDWMQRNVAWRDVLAGHSWQFGGMRGSQEQWYRPGKPPSGPPSALTNKDGTDRLFVLTTNGGALENERYYDKLGAFARLEGLSMSDAARAARERFGMGPAHVERDTAGVEAFVQGAKGSKVAAPAKTTAQASNTWLGVTMGGSFEFTQAGNAARFVSKFGHLVRYVPGTGWRVWDDKRWAVDVDGSYVLELAHGIISDLDAEISQGLLDKDDAKKAASHRNATATAGGLAAAVKLASSYAAIRAKAADFDTNGWLLNTPAGTYDIERGELREHRQSDLITKMTVASPEFGAACPRFDAFLASAMPTEVDRTFLQRMAGYASSGVIREHVLTVNWGPEGRNGKTTFWEHAFAMCMGDDYTQPAPREMLLEPLRGQRGHPAEMECLRGRRLVWSSEPGDRRRLDSELCKALSGNDAIQSRGMRENFSTFRQTAKVTILANRLDVLKGLDVVTWNRMRIIMWPASFLGREDRGLPDALKEEAGAILARIIEWSQDWRVNGLGEPGDDARRDALRYTNPVEAFLRERCEVGKDFKVANRDLHEAFQMFVAEIGIDKDDDLPDTSDGFGKAIGGRFTSRPIHSIRYRIGLRLREASPAKSAPDDACDELPLAFFPVGRA